MLSVYRQGGGDVCVCVGVGVGGGGDVNLHVPTSLEEVMLLGKAERRERETKEKFLSTEAPANRRCRSRLNSQL